ncbi:hypothetical protein HZP42_19250 [Elizabethkingia anophelis]|nr:hypothetical protein [Elizabethkingia anophelis]MDV3594159.1 hypothetical protein [Elizabethkingia anophelis]
MKYEVTKEQILEAHADACNEWKEKLEEWFPKVFEQKCEVGKWYWANEKAKREKTFLFFNNGKNVTYGFGWDGEWGNYINHGGEIIMGIIATDREVEKRLVIEANKRGYKKGVIFKCPYSTSKDFIELNNEEFDFEVCGYDPDSKCGMCLRDREGHVLFSNGMWSEIITQSNPVEVSKSDIAKLMNVEVSNLKIVD